MLAISPSHFVYVLCTKVFVLALAFGESRKNQRKHRFACPVESEDIPIGAEKILSGTEVLFFA